MPKRHLTKDFVSDPPAPNSIKINYFDEVVPGFLLEVRTTGKSTYYQRYRDRSGRLRQARIGHTDSISLDDARQKARYLRSQSVMGFDPNEELLRYKNCPTFKEFVENNYLPFVMMHKRSWQQDQNMIRRRIENLWGNLKMVDITREDIETFQAVMFKKNKPGTVNRYMALVKYIFNLAEHWEVIDKNPSRGVSKIEDNNHKERYLTSDETERLLEELKNCQSKVVPDVIEFLILTGARKGEALGLRWDELNLNKGIWVVPSERNKSKVNKVLPLSKGALNVLSRRINNNSEYVFPNPKTSKPLTHIHATWDRIRRNAGIPDVRIHDIRHNFASLLVNSGRSLYEVQKLLGHSQLCTTQRYAHLTQNTLKDATETVSDLVITSVNNNKVS